MKFLNWLMGSAPSITSNAPRIAPPTTHRKVSPPDPTISDTIEDEAIDTVATIDLEQVFCMIDYTDAAGNETRRRITTQKVSRGQNAPILRAVCHERRALRSFRCDRIDCFITMDGEVITTPEYFADTFGVDLKTLAPGKNEERVQAARILRDLLRPALSILVLAARSDDEFHPEELEVICNYIEDEAFDAIDRGIIQDIDPAVLDQTTKLVRNMRPQASSAAGYLEKVMEISPERYTRFRDALDALILADGHISLGEDMFLADLDAAREQLKQRNGDI